MQTQPIYILSKASHVHQHPEHQHMDEYDDIVLLLKDHGRDDSLETQHIVAYVADACMGSNHLWQDMQLPNRKALSELMLHYFPTLAAKNTGDMKWKKFFYKQLCEREEIFICKSPSCGECVDYQLCFESEEASS
jgi:nitrogen fixation protein NifQ